MQGVLNSNPIREEKVDAVRLAVRAGMEDNTRTLDTAIDAMLDDFIEVAETCLSAH